MVNYEFKCPHAQRFTVRLSSSQRVLVHSDVLCVFLYQGCGWWLFFSSSPLLSWLLGNEEDVSEEKTAQIRTTETIKKKKVCSGVNEGFTQLPSRMYRYTHPSRLLSYPLFCIYESNGTHDWVKAKEWTTMKNWNS